MAATIQEAIDDIVRDIGSVIPTVTTRMTTWTNSMFIVPTLFPGPGAPWDKASLDQRSVYDWSVPTIQASAAVQEAGNTIAGANIAINTVFRTLKAVQAAFAAGRITADQQTSVVAAYTSSWE